MKRALITGSEGFVGRHFYRRLREDGWSVRGIDVDNPWNPRDCMDFFRKDNPPFPQMDLVIHCAATIPNLHERQRRRLAVAGDFALDSQMFQWALRAKPKHVVYFSSSAAYPIHLQQQHGHKLTEDDIDLNSMASPDDIYGLTKLVGEVQAMALREDGIPVTIVRPFTGYGEDQSLDYPFPAMMRRAQQHRDPFEVWGDGSQVRDFIHIDDIVDAVMVIVEQSRFNGPVNLGTGRPVSLLELAQMVIYHEALCSAGGYDPTIKTLPEMPTGAVYRCADTTLLDTIFKPSIDLETGIRRALG